MKNHEIAFPLNFPYSAKMSDTLQWPLESAAPTNKDPFRWYQSGSNICLDFHGDPVTAGLAVFSDGNHHMALEESLQAFLALHPDIDDIFYATTPPRVLVNYLKSGKLLLGNLTLSRQPDVFISPPNIMDALQSEGFINTHQPFMQSRGNVLLIRRDNPKNIKGLEDIMRDDVHLFISNPSTEKASYEVYKESILLLGQEAGLDPGAIQERLSDTGRTCFGELIHHREAPQYMADGRADVALVYYHLALRYTRIFPDLFDFIPLGGDKENPQPSQNNVTTTYHIAPVVNGGAFSETFYNFMLEDSVTEIYARHGLRRPE